MFFLSPKIICFFFKSATIQCERWAEKKHMFFCNARPKSNARAHLRQGKKHSGLHIACSASTTAQLVYSPGGSDSDVQ